MAWVGDHIFSYGQAYAAAMCVCCPESPETVVEDRREIGPTYFFAPPRVFENLLTQIMVRMEDAGWLKQRMFQYFLGVARRCGEQILDGKPVGAWDRLLYRLGDLLVYAPLRNRMGFSRTRVAYTAGEAIGPELFRFYRSLGVNLKQLYGQTEASVYITMQPDGEVYPDTVGKPAPDVQIKIAESGEVLFKSPGVFLKYYKNDAATKETKTPDGWVHTGDAGFFDQRGHLKIIDRAKDVGRLNNGGAVRTEVPREPHQVLSGGAGGGGVRPGARLRDDVHQHRSDLGRQLGRAQQCVLRQLSGARRAPAGPGDHRQAGGRAQQGAGRRAADGGLAGPALPHPAEGARRRRRRADPHAEGAPLA